MLDNTERAKIKKIYEGGKTRYVIRHGMINWGLSTGIIFRILSIISKEGWSIKAVLAGLPTLNTLFSMIVFAIFGAIWGYFFWKWIEKEALKQPEKSSKSKVKKKK